jgi:hypothetical protein
MVLFY